MYTPNKKNSNKIFILAMIIYLPWLVPFRFLPNCEDSHILKTGIIILILFLCKCMGNLGPRRCPTRVPQKPHWASLIFNEQISPMGNTHNFEYLSNININWSENYHNTFVNHFYIIFFLHLFSVLVDNFLLLLLPTSILLPQSTHPEDTHARYQTGGCHHTASVCCHSLKVTLYFTGHCLGNISQCLKGYFFLKLWKLYYFCMV